MQKLFGNGIWQQNCFEKAKEYTGLLSIMPLGANHIITQHTNYSLTKCQFKVQQLQTNRKTWQGGVIHQKQKYFQQQQLETYNNSSIPALPRQKDIIKNSKKHPRS